MLASHSPVVLSQVARDEVLCFAKTKEGITDIVKGSEHPALKDWKGKLQKLSGPGLSQYAGTYQKMVFKRALRS